MGRLAYRLSDVLRKLGRAGFVEVSQRGSHIKLAKRTTAGTLTVIVPSHREIATGTLRSILRQAAMSVEDFEAL